MCTFEAPSTHTHTYGYCGKIDSNWIHIHLFAATSIWHFYTLNVYLEIVLFEDGLHFGTGKCTNEILEEQSAVQSIYEVDGRDNLNVVRVASAILSETHENIFQSTAMCNMYIPQCIVHIQVVRPLCYCIRSRWSEAHMLGEDRKELQSFCILALLQYITSENIFRISMVWSRNIRTKHTVQHTCAQWRMDM